MITVQIPAAIRRHSPVLWRISPPDSEAIYIAAVVVHVHSDGTLAVSARHGGVLIDDDDVQPDDVSLIISDPTGAAHLAWWLRDLPARGRETCRADFIAIGCSPLTLVAAMRRLVDIIERAANGRPVTTTELEMLRDYALRVVSNG